MNDYVQRKQHEILYVSAVSAFKPHKVIKSWLI